MADPEAPGFRRYRYRELLAWHRVLAGFRNRTVAGMYSCFSKGGAQEEMET